MIRGRCDSFVLKTDVHFPTDINLLYDAIRTLIHVCAKWHGQHIDQIRRRAIQDESIPHAEKVFSLFQLHTEWISKGKAGVPVELGLRVCIMEDSHGFILHSLVCQKTTDDKSRYPWLKPLRRNSPALMPTVLIKASTVKPKRTENSP